MKHPFISRSACRPTIGLVRTTLLNCPRATHGPRLAALACVLACALAAATAQASDRRDHDRVREAVQAGEVMPLPALLERLQRTHPGQVLELELEREQGRWVFEVRLLQPGGRLLKLQLDARSGEVLKSKARDRREATAPALAPAPAPAR